MTLIERLFGLLSLVALGFGVLCAIDPRQTCSFTLVSVYCKNTGRFLVRDTILRDEYSEPTGRIFLRHDQGETVISGTGDYLIIRRLCI